MRQVVNDLAVSIH